MRKIVNVSLPEHLYEEVETAVKHGGYATKSELFRDLLRDRKKVRPNQKKFQARTLLKNVKKHAQTGGPTDLSEKHDHYLYQT